MLPSVITLLAMIPHEGKLFYKNAECEFNMYNMPVG